MVNHWGVRRFLKPFWALTTGRVVRAITIVGLLLWLLMMLAVMTMNLVDQAPGTWLWLAPAGLSIGPVLVMVLSVGWVRRKWSPAIRRALAAGAFIGAAGLSLWAAYQDRVVGILGALCGVGWHMATGAVATPRCHPGP